jgi:hypothetical protein
LRACVLRRWRQWQHPHPEQSNTAAGMARVLFERVTNNQGTSWRRSHGTDRELFALCSHALHPDAEGVSEGTGEITCPDCIDIIRRCKAIPDSELAPEYENALFHRRLDR